MSDKVGSISLDLEIKADIQKQLSEITGTIGQDLKKSISDMLNGTVSGMKSQMKSSMGSMAKEISKGAKDIGKGLEEVQEQAEETSESITEAMRAAIASVPIDRGEGFSTAAGDAEEYKEKIQQVEEALDALSNKKVKIEYPEGSLENLRAQLEILETKKDIIMEADFVYDDQFSTLYDNFSVQSRNIQDEIKRITESIKEVPQTSQQTQIKFADEKVYKLNDELRNLKDKLKELEAENYGPGTEKWDETYRRIMHLQDQIKEYKAQLKQVATDAEATFRFDNLDGSRSQIEEYTFHLENLKKTLKSLESEGYRMGSDQWDETYRQIKSVEGALNSYKKTLAEGDKEQKQFSWNLGRLPNLFRRAGSAAKQAGRDYKKTSNDSNILSKSLFRLSGMFKALLMRSLVRQIVSGAKDGFQNLAQYSDQVNQSISSMMSALTLLKNSFATAFAPILNVVAPILTKFINMLAQAVSYIGMFFAALTSQGSFTKALGVQEDYAGSLGNTAENTAAADEAAKEYEKTLAGFDEIEKVGSEDSGSGSGGSGAAGAGAGVGEMFETVAIDSWASNLADSVKGILQSIFAPIKQAWEDYGQEVMDAWKYALKEVKEAISGVGNTWLDVWTNGAGYETTKNVLLILKEIGLWIGDIAVAWQGAWDNKGYAFVESIFYMLNQILEVIHTISESYRAAWNSGSGQEILEHIFQILTDINNVIGNLAAGFRDAWNTAGLGNAVAQSILDLINLILSTIEMITGATVEWSGKLDFTPLLQSIYGLLESIKPLTQNIGDGLAWFYENVLLPLASYTIQDLIPAFLNLLSGAIDVVNAVIERLKPIFTWFWDGFLKPVASWTGGVIVDVLNGIGKAFEKIAGNELAVTILTSLAIAIGVVVGAIGAYNVVGAIAAGVTTLLSGAIAILTSPVTLVIGAIAGLITIFTLLYKNVDGFREFVDRVVELGGNMISGLFEGIKNALSAVGTFLKTYVFDPIVNAFKSLFGIHSPSTVFAEFGGFLMQGLFNGISALIDTVVAIFTTIWESLRDIATTFVEAIQTVVTTVFDAIYKVFETIWNAIKSIFETAWKLIESIVTGSITSVRDLINAVLEAIKTIISTILNTIATIFKTIWEGIKNVVSTIINAIKTVINTVWNTIKSIISSVLQTISGIFSSIWNGIKDTVSSVIDRIKEIIDSVMSGISYGIDSALETIKNAFSTVFNSVKDTVSGIFNDIWSIIKGVVNSILGGIESMVNGVISAMNSFARVMNSMSIDIPDWVPGIGGGSIGFSLPTWSNVSLPRLATGGIIDSPTIAMVGEAGKEAVVPLENNTQGLSLLAGMLVERMGGIGTGGGITKQEMQTIMGEAVGRIVAALSGLGFYIDSELIARAVIKAVGNMNYRGNPVVVK